MTMTAAAPAHAVSDTQPGILGTPPGFTDSYTVAINDAGSVLGTVQLGNRPPVRAVRWDNHGRATQLDLPSGTDNSAATGINNHDVAVGAVDRSGTHTRAVRWDRRGHVTELDLPPGSTTSLARGINDAGVVMGQAWMTNGDAHAVRWDIQGHVTDLGVLPGHTNSDVIASNDQGVIAGTSCQQDGGCRAVRWGRDGRIEELDLLPGYVGSSASGMNNRGTVIGGSWASSTVAAAVRWDRAGTITVVQAPSPEDTEIGLVAINQVDVIAGMVFRPDGVIRAARWDQRNHGTILDTESTWLSTPVVDINDAGSIAGTAAAMDGSPYAVR
ncbi:hypothetical protein [Actinocrispum sp. NPDC049592]|uniref:hypothetical protein n=1 Tax=Actinocrispum sp. NPDC049592 TaxID=3154835 RepID=UPI003434176D